MVSNTNIILEKLSCFLNIPIYNSWDKDFTDFQRLFPQFFKVGNNESHIQQFSVEEMNLFGNFTESG